MDIQFVVYPSQEKLFMRTEGNIPRLGEFIWYETKSYIVDRVIYNYDRNVITVQVTPL